MLKGGLHTDTRKSPSPNGLRLYNNENKESVFARSRTAMEFLMQQYVAYSG